MYINYFFFTSYLYIIPRFMTRKSLRFSLSGTWKWRPPRHIWTVINTFYRCIILVFYSIIVSYTVIMCHETIHSHFILRHVLSSLILSMLRLSAITSKFRPVAIFHNRELTHKRSHYWRYTHYVTVPWGLKESIAQMHINKRKWMCYKITLPYPSAESQNREILFWASVEGFPISGTA